MGYNKMIAKKIFVIVAIVSLAACSDSVKRTLRLERPTPDTFKVVTNPPLSVPPQYDLIEPSEGRDSKSSLSGGDKATKELLYGDDNRKNSAKNLSKDEENFLNKIPGQSPKSDIREVIDNEYDKYNKTNKEGNILKKTRSYIKNLQGSDEPVVDALKEKERLSKNKKEGKPANEGKVPEIQNGGDKSVIDKIFR